MLTIFELDITKQASDLEEAILLAFAKANDTQKMTQLCLSWNRYDIAKEHIFNDDFNGDVGSHTPYFKKFRLFKA